MLQFYRQQIMTRVVFMFTVAVQVSEAIRKK